MPASGITRSGFSKHGMKSVAYWLPLDEPDSKDALVISSSMRTGQEHGRVSLLIEMEKGGPSLRRRPIGQASGDAARSTDYSAIR